MATQATTKVRLVRCPRCRMLLAESPEVTLYKCGGCGTILLAKTRKVDADRTESSCSQMTDSVAKVNASENEEARSSNGDLNTLAMGDYLLDKDITNQGEHGDSILELCEDTSVLDALSTSPEVNSNGTEDSTVEKVQEPSRRDESKRPLDQDSTRYEAKELTPEASEHNKSHLPESQRMLQEDDGFVDRIKNLSEYEDQENDLASGDVENRDGGKHDYVSLGNEEKGQTCSAGQNGGVCGEIRHAGVDSSSAGIVSRKNGKASDEPSIEDSVAASQWAVKGSIVSSDHEHLDHPMRKFRKIFGSASSLDTLASSPLADHPSSEHGVKKHGDMTGFPTTRSYYGYDGSESSYDDDHSPQHISRPSRRKWKCSDHISTTSMHKKDGYRVNDMLSSEPEVNYQAPSSSVSQGNQHHDIRLGRSQSPSTYKHNMLPSHPGLRSLDKPSCSEPDEMDLLRTVRDLKDQLNRIQFLKAAANGRYPAGLMEDNRAPYYYDSFTPEREIYSDLDHPRYHLHNQERCNVSRMAFSGEAAHYRQHHHVNCSCLHCCPQDRHYSAQLPLRSTPCNGYCEIHTGHNRRNISSSSSPDHNTSSELLLWDHETQPHNQRHRDREMQRLLREKYHTARRHVRPLAGGAPMVPCYHCSELLQLPADFLLFKKRYHQLRCGACGEVLIFALLKGKHIVPCLPDASAPPPGETGKHGVATNLRSAGPISHSNSGQHVEPVTCDDDYDRSFSRTTCSTEGEASSFTPSRDLIERNRNTHRKLSSSSGYDPTEDRRMKSIMKESHNKNKSSVEIVESVGPSSMETQKWTPSTSSPLHRLMGYGSARQVLNKE